MKTPWGAGHIIADRYRLERPLGEGGMGSVWQAEHLSLKSPVAIKLLNPAIADDPEILERFMREAQSAAALRGTYVVQIFDYGVEEGVPFIAMEMLQGESLGERLEKRQRIAPNELAKIFADVTRGLGKAHELGIIHRDLKPDNIFLVREGDEEIAKVLDFGIAKVSEGSLTGSSGSGTRTGAMLGTPFYMSPEQAQGNKAVDHRTDLWAMAIIAFECLVGQRPFESDALGDLVLQICTKEAPVPSSLATVPQGFDAWFTRATQKSPEGRFQSMREMSSALAQALASAEVGSMAELASAATMVHTPVGDAGQQKGMAQTTNGHAAAAIDIPKNPTVGSKWLAIGAAAVLVLVGALFALLGGSEVEQAELEPSAEAPEEAAPVQAAQPPAEPEPEPEIEPPAVQAPAEASKEDVAKEEPPKEASKAPVTPAAVPKKRAVEQAPKPAVRAAPKPASKPPPPKPSAPQKKSGADLFSDRQ